MNGIFISYRREDTEGFARSLFQSLVAHFGQEQVFMDVEGIELGMDFVEALDQSLGACGVLLVLIGKEWVTGVDASGRRRLDNPEDFVRLEVASALKRNIRVIPIRVRGAVMPDPQELPDDLKLLTRRQALELRHDHWDADVRLLITALEKALGLTPKKVGPAVQQAQPVATAASATAKSRWKLPLLLVGLVLVGVVVTLFIPDGEEPVPVQTWEAAPSAPPSYVAEEPVSPEAPWEPPPAIPEPLPAPPPFPDFTDTMVFEAQELLAQLGYEPGPVDGQVGERTTRAVRAFQRDNGLPATGRISDDLIDALYATLERRQGMPFPPPESYPPTVNMTGIWFDEEGVRYSIVHEGYQIHYQAFDMYGTIVAMGEGRLEGQRVDYVMVGADGSQWRGQGMLSDDGRQMEYRVVNLMNGLQDGGWIRREDAIR